MIVVEQRLLNSHSQISLSQPEPVEELYVNKLEQMSGKYLFL